MFQLTVPYGVCVCVCVLTLCVCVCVVCVKVASVGQTRDDRSVSSHDKTSSSDDQRSSVASSVEDLA